jgi:lysozyme
MRSSILFYVFLISITLGCGGEIGRRTDYEIDGIDISRYQSRINWKELVEQKFDFVFVKATEGGDHRDTMFDSHWESIKKAGLKRGAYHFFRPGISPLLQAKNFINQVELQPGDLPPVIDIEVTDGASKTIIVNRIKSWLEIVEIRYGVKPIIYTHLKFYYNYIVGNFDDYPLWIAKYGDVKPQLVNSEKFKFWQYSNHGEVKGIKGDVDFNVFDGSRDDFDAFCIKHNSAISAIEAK